MILTANLNFSNMKFNVICIDVVVMTASLTKLLILNGIAYYIIAPAVKKISDANFTRREKLQLQTESKP